MPMMGDRRAAGGSRGVRRRGRRPPPGAVLLVAILAVASCTGPLGPRETRLQGGLGDRIGIAPTQVEGVAGAGITLAEIRGRTVEPRCAQAGLVMTSLRTRRRDDGAQEFTARCGLPFAADMATVP